MILKILKLVKKLYYIKINKIFNVGNGKAISINSISKLFNKYNKRIKFSKPSLIAKKELVSTKADIKNVKKYFKWFPFRKIDYSILTTIKYSKFYLRGCSLFCSSPFFFGGPLNRIYRRHIFF